MPLHLQMSITMELNKDTFARFPLFSKLGNKSYLAWIGSRFRALSLCEGQKVYQEGDDIETFYFMTTGQACFALSKQNSLFFAVIDPQSYQVELKKRIKKTMNFQYFGMEDSIYNHTKLVISQQQGVRLNKKEGENLLNKRRFAVHVVKSGESLTLSF